MGQENIQIYNNLLKTQCKYETEKLYNMDFHFEEK